jgi:hypothetical protein
MAAVAKAMWAARGRFTDAERKTLGLFLELYSEEWEFFAFLAGMTFDDAEETRKKLQDR